MSDGLVVLTGHPQPRAYRIPEEHVRRWEWQGMTFATHPMVDGTGRLDLRWWMVSEVSTGRIVGWEQPTDALAETRAVERLERAGAEVVRQRVTCAVWPEGVEVQDVTMPEGAATSDTCAACGASWGAPRLCQGCGASGCSSCLGEAEGRVLLCRACRLAETLVAMDLPPDLPARHAALQAEKAERMRRVVEMAIRYVCALRASQQPIPAPTIEWHAAHEEHRAAQEALVAAVDALDAAEADHAE